jgi:hypothetical protein
MADSALVATLVKGLDVHRRPNGRVITIKPARAAEVVLGKGGSVRVNFRTRPTGAPKNLLSTGTGSWPGGGVSVTSENLATVRKLIEVAVEAATPKTPDPDKPVVTASRLRPRQPQTETPKPAEAPKPEPAKTGGNGNGKRSTGVQAFATATA